MRTKYFKVCYRYDGVYCVNLVSAKSKEAVEENYKQTGYDVYSVREVGEKFIEEATEKHMPFYEIDL